LDRRYIIIIIIIF